MKSIEASLPLCVCNLQTDQDEKGNLRVVSVFSFPPSFCGFSGHFPGNPILPGIVQLAAVRYLAEQAVQKQLLPLNINKTKFRAMIQPDQEVQIKLDLHTVKNEYQCKFQIRTVNDEMIASGHCIFSETLS